MCVFLCVYIYIQTHILYIQYIVYLLCTVANDYYICDLHFIHSCLLSNFNFRFIFQLKVVMLWFISGWFSLWLYSSLKNVLKPFWRKWLGKTLQKPGPLANVWSPLCSIVPRQASVSVITHSSEPQCSFIVLYLSSASQLTLNPNFTINTKVINDLKGTLVSYMLLSAICGLWSARCELSRVLLWAVCHTGWQKSCSLWNESVQLDVMFNSSAPAQAGLINDMDALLHFMRSHNGTI